VPGTGYLAPVDARAGFG